MVDLARRNGYPWDAILDAEVARDYKPKQVVYLAAAEEFGLRTAFVARPDEYGINKSEAAPVVPVNLSVSNRGYPDSVTDNLLCSAQ